MNKGFLIVQLQIGAAILALLTVFVYNDFAAVLGGLYRMADDVQLYDAARYIKADLEKDLAYEGKLLTVEKDYRGNAVVKCRTIYAGKQYIYTLENNGLYKQTDTLLTKGKNPLFIPACPVKQWQVRRISDKVLEIRFVLVHKARSRSFTQTIRLLNGVIADEM